MFLKDYRLDFIFGTSTAAQALFYMGGLHMYFALYFAEFFLWLIEEIAQRQDWVLSLLHSAYGVYIFSSVLLMLNLFFDFPTLCLPFIFINMAVIVGLTPAIAYTVYLSSWEHFVERLEINQVQVGPLSTAHLLFAAAIACVCWLMIAEWSVISAFRRLNRWNHISAGWRQFRVNNFLTNFLLHGWDLRSVDIDLPKSAPQPTRLQQKSKNL